MPLNANPQTLKPHPLTDELPEAQGHHRGPDATAAPPLRRDAGQDLQAREVARSSRPRLHA